MWILLLALTLICARGWKEGRVSINGDFKRDIRGIKDCTS